MSKLLRVVAIGLIALAFALPVIAHAQTSAHVDVITVGGTIDTWIEGYINRGISVAEQDGAQALVIVLNTPGGALGATQNITTRMLNARVPVVVFVYPQGAWAGSAGTFVTMAANIAAMAPTTTIGAAHPVAGGGEKLEGDERDKITNFSVSIIQNLAKQRGRNVEWAGKAVKESIAATAQEALDLKVIDLIATDLNDLLNKMDGRTVKTAAGEFTLQTKRAGLNNIDMNLPEVILHTMVDPNLALILLQIGLLAIAVELYNPGATLPAVVGGICLILAFYALHLLPVNYAGLALIVLAILMFILEVKITSHGILAIGGITSMVIGSLLLFESPQPYYHLSLPVIIGAVVITALFFIFIVGFAVRAHLRKPVTGKEGLLGEEGVAKTDLNPTGTIMIHGELWNALSVSGFIKGGESVKVTKMKGMSLEVTKTS